MRCGDSVVVQSAGRVAAPLELVNEAWALPPSVSVAEPQDMAAKH